MTGGCGLGLNQPLSGPLWNGTSSYGSDVSALPLPEPGVDAAVEWVGRHLDDLCSDAPRASTRFRGGQTAADAALASFDVGGYAGRRNEVLPVARRGASGLSPWIRHGLLTLPDVWAHVAGGPSRDVAKFRDELLWQEYARHVYARVGRRSSVGLRHEHAGNPRPATRAHDLSAEPAMRCVAAVADELEADGWLVNQTRMWMASHWTVRNGWRWQDGEDLFFRHLLDGSRAANRLGWQWTTGVGSSKPYGFSRWQVEKRAPQLCRDCELAARCPIEGWPDDPTTTPAEVPVDLGRATAAPAMAGPAAVERTGGDPDAVWLTAESLGDADPALAAHPEADVHFVFDEPLLARLQLSSKRLIFLTETLAELGTHRTVNLHRGRPADLLSGVALAVTHAPVPGFATRARRLNVVEAHPWPWLARPSGGSVRSFSAWRKGLRLAP